MNLRDELKRLHPFNESPRLLEVVMEHVERALAGERAATISALSGEVLASHMGFECRRRAHIGKKQHNGVCAWCLADRLETYEMHGRSALDKMLAQARREQREKDAQLCDRLHVNWVSTASDELRLPRENIIEGLKRAAAAIRAQEDSP